MKTISLALSMDEVDMLNSWLGQLSDGCGENKRWTTPYWRNLSFDTTGVTIQDENDRPFKGKSDKDILDDLGDRFIDISNEYQDYCALSEYFDDKRSEDLNLGVRVVSQNMKEICYRPDNWALTNLDLDTYTFDITNNNIVDMKVKIIGSDEYTFEDVLVPAGQTITINAHNNHDLVSFFDDYVNGTLADDIYCFLYQVGTTLRSDNVIILEEQV